MAKQIPCEIDSVCIHGDNDSSLATAKSIKDNLLENGLILKPLKPNEKIYIDIKNFFYFFYFNLIISKLNSAGSSNDNSAKVKSDYDKAVTIIKSAKKYEKKGKIEKANKRYEKALSLLIKSNEKKPTCS